MPNPTWPGTLPAFVMRPGYSEKPGDNTLETPQKVADAQPSFDLKGLVLRIVTEDIAQGGQAAKRMESTYGLNRAAGAY